MSSSGNTIGILVPQPSAPAMVSKGSANPPEPLTNAAGPVDVIEMVADVASSALSLVAPDSAAANVADAVSDVVSLASMVPGLPSVRLPSRKMVSGFGGGSGAGSDGGVVTSGHGHCIPCKVAAAIGNPVNAVLGIKVLFDETEVDFGFDSPLPLVWQRSYYSDQIGNGWLGQGWSLPFSMRLVRTADGFLYIDEQGREISLPDISDEAEEPYSAADDGEDNLYEEEAAPQPVSAEEDPYGLDDAYFDPYEQIYFSQVSDDLYQIASPDGGARLLFAEVDSGCGIFQLVAQLDRNGRHIRLCYDDNGLLHSIYDGSGRHFQPVFSSIRLHDNDPDFDPAGERDVFVSEDERFYVNRLTSVTFNGKELVRYDYDGYGDLTAVYGRDGKKLRGFAYRNHIMVEHSQPDGLVSRYEYDRYDTDGKVLKSSNNLGEEWTFEYRKDHTVITDALGRTEVYGFDENRELIYRIDADGQRSDSERDDYGRITVERDPLGRETRYLYDTEGNVIAITAPDGSSTQIDYHETLNLPIAVNDPAGRITTYDYDALGNLIYRQLPNGENQYYQYDLENQLVRAEIKKPAGNTEIWTYAYDPFGRRLSKERQDKLAWTSTDPKRTHFVWDGSRLLQEYTYKGNYTYIYTDQDSYEPLAQVFDNAKDGKQYLAYFHNDQIGIPREMTDIHGNLLWYGEYTAWGRLKKDERVYRNAHQPFRLQNQYYDEETGLHYNLMRYYEPEAGRFVNQDPIGLWGGANLYQFAPNANVWVDPLGLKVRVGNHGHLRKIKDGQQSHHLNQDAAFRSKIPREEGAAIKLKGNAFRDIGSDHYNVHKELEKFWDQYRRGGSKFGQVPTIGEYNKALENSLKQTSMSP